MKSNTKLIMETWRRFLKEGPFMDNPDIESDEGSLDILEDEPEAGYYDDEYNPDGFSPDDDLDNPIAGEPHFENPLPPRDHHLESMEEEVPYEQEDEFDETNILDDDLDYDEDQFGDF